MSKFLRVQNTLQLDYPGLSLDQAIVKAQDLQQQAFEALDRCDQELKRLEFERDQHATEFCRHQNNLELFGEFQEEE